MCRQSRHVLNKAPHLSPSQYCPPGPSYTTCCRIIHERFSAATAMWGGDPTSLWWCSSANTDAVHSAYPFFVSTVAAYPGAEFFFCSFLGLACQPDVIFPRSTSSPLASVPIPIRLFDLATLGCLSPLYGLADVPVDHSVWAAGLYTPSIQQTHTLPRNMLPGAGVRYTPQA